MAPQTCCSGSATTAFMISGTYCFTSSLRTHPTTHVAKCLILHSALALHLIRQSAQKHSTTFGCIILAFRGCKQTF